MLHQSSSALSWTQFTEKKHRSFKQLVSTLALKILGRFDRNSDARGSGIIVNTSGWIDGPGFDVSLHRVNALEINVVLAVSHDKSGFTPR